jgi:hypothetical protein
MTDHNDRPGDDRAEESGLEPEFASDANAADPRSDDAMHRLMDASLRGHVLGDEAMRHWPSLYPAEEFPRQRTLERLLRDAILAAVMSTMPSERSEIIGRLLGSVGCRALIEGLEAAEVEPTDGDVDVMINRFRVAARQTFHATRDWH